MSFELLKDKVILDMAEIHTMPRLSLINSQTTAAITSLNPFLKCISAVVLMNTRFTTECVISRGSFSRRQSGLIKTQFRETQTKIKGKKNYLVSNPVNKESNNFEEILCPDFIKSSMV